MLARRLLLLFLALMLLGALTSLVNPKFEPDPRRPGLGPARAGPAVARAGRGRDVSAILPRAGARRVIVRRGDRVSLRVRSPRPDTASVDGYDAVGSTDPDSPAELDFVAEKSGRFPVRLVDASTIVGELVVRDAAR